MAGTPFNDFATNTFAIDNLADYDVIARSHCRRISIQEDYDSGGAATADLIKKVPAGATGIKVFKGTNVIYTPTNGLPYFERGDRAGTIRTSAGSITVQQDETAQV